MCAAEINAILKVNHVTSDGDSHSYAGMKAVFPACKNLKDTRHLAKSIKRAIGKASFSSGMLTGGPRFMAKSTLKCRLGLDVKRRCVAELRHACPYTT